MSLNISTFALILLDKIPRVIRDMLYYVLGMTSFLSFFSKTAVGDLANLPPHTNLT